ncbi:MAG: hypothetical protein QOD63_1088 [Actinomycetota bacterium]|jgi:Flp pilus assembly protein TadG|nr:hypothetical protein [Actinomycetota bacterium]
MTARRPRHDEGSVTLETVVLAPAFLLFLAVLVVGGRVALAGNAVAEAADEAARAASIARTATTARATAEDTALAALRRQSLHCSSTPTVTIDTAGFAVPVGQPAQVTATVTCHVNLSDLAIPGFPGGRTVTATSVSTLDTYRQRQ